MRRYGSPRTGTHSLQVEICKRLFMDEESGERGPRFTRLQSELREVIRLVCRYAEQRSDAPKRPESAAGDFRKSDKGDAR